MRNLFLGLIRAYAWISEMGERRRIQEEDGSFAKK